MRLIHRAAALMAAVPLPASACVSCGCTLTADWLSQGLVTRPGTTLGFRYDYIPQTQLRSGRHAVDRDDLAFPNDREIERYTYNHYLTASLDRQFDERWGLDVQLPFVIRPHATIAEGDVAQSTSDTHGIGDVRVIGRWQGLSTAQAINGLQLGLQLPTGRIHQRFEGGPAAGEEADRGIQPGFGVTQLVLGLYRYGALGGDVAYIAQLQGQVPLHRRDAYRPGAYGQASVGVQYTRWRGVTPQLQLNFRVTERDRGANSDTYNSGGEQLYVAPGLIARAGRRVSVFAYAQLPVYQRLTGYQLAPRATLSVGAQYQLP